MKSPRRPAAETRARILETTRALMVEDGPGSVTVASVMRRADISRTAFYRQFNSIYDVFTEILRDVRAELLGESGEWITESGMPGTPAVVHPNLERYATATAQYIDLLAALDDACSLDPQLRALWREHFVQPFVDASEASIARGQAAGVLASDLDAPSTALMLTLLGEIASMELLGRRKVTPKRYADLLAPIWTKALFGVVPDTE